MSKKIKFRDYSKYPIRIMAACHFRDEYGDEPDGAFFAIAEEMGLTDALEKMAVWEWDNVEIVDELQK